MNSWKLNNIMPENRSNVSPKIAFILGLVTGIAIFGLIGFTVMLVRGSDGNDVPPAGDDAANSDDSAEDIVMVPVSEADHIRGSIDAPVKIVEFSDLECPFCKKHHSTMKQVVAEYGDQVAWVYRHFPLTSLHQKAVKESEASECVADLGGEEAFWNFVDKIYEVSPGNDGLDLATLPDLAEGVGVDKAAFTECLDSGQMEGKVRAQYEDAIASGGRGTPHNIVVAPDGSLVPLPGAYPFESFKEIIDQMLATN